jgi:EAL domain-containing protein (putative c-di-GMP-specific phosphodiesterase class I)
VESQAQADFLRALHCDVFQGYLFGRPVDAATFEREHLRRAT